MRTPTEFELEQLRHVYDPVEAHKYYEEHKKLKGRKPGKKDDVVTFEDGSSTKVQALRKRGLPDPRKGKQQAQIHKDAREKQRKELATSILKMVDRLHKLEALIKKREHEAKQKDHKSEAKKERAAKERDKPKTAAEKAKASRENEKYRDKHKSELKAKAKKRDGHGGDSKKGKDKEDSGKHSIHELKALATRVKGQIAVAKQKLLAL